MMRVMVYGLGADQTSTKEMDFAQTGMLLAFITSGNSPKDSCTNIALLHLCIF